MSSKEFSAYGGDKIIDLENESVVDAFSEAIGGGSGEDFTINFEINWEIPSLSVKTCDKTMAEIVANYGETKRIPNITLEGYPCPVWVYSAYYNSGESANYVDLVLGQGTTLGSQPYITVLCLRGYGYTDGDMWEISQYQIDLSLE